MSRALSAWREWLELRGRLHDEYRFHIEQAQADLRGLGLSGREAGREARLRFGSRRNLRTARRELGGDLKGLTHLLRAHRVTASLGFQPLVLITAMLVLLALSPAPRELVEGVLGRTLNPADRGAVVLSSHPLGGIYEGITPTDFRELQSMTTLRAVNRYRLDARGLAVQGVHLETVTAEAQAKTHNRGFYASWASDQTMVSTAPAKVVWALAATFGIFFLRRPLSYAVGLGFLNAAASLVLWAFVVQICGEFLSVAFVGYLVLTAMQCLWFWRDLGRRCPVCLDRLVLPLTAGRWDRLLLNPQMTESVCAHGHGALVECWWSRRFRRGEESGALIY